MRLLCFAAALYLIAPGHPDVPLAGLPLGQTGAFLLIVVIAAFWWTRDVAVAPHPAWWRAAAAVVVLKVVMAGAAPPSGWLATYYANDRFAAPIEQSVDFRWRDATRIDRQLSFGEDQFPVHFFNDYGFNFGVKREVTEPFSVEWRGHLDVAEAVTLDTDSRGDLEITVDGARVAAPVTIPAGAHLVEIRYRKPANTSGALRVMPQGRQWRIGEVTPLATPAWRRTLARVSAWLAWLLHGVTLLVIGAGIGPAVWAKARGSWSLVRTAPLEGLHAWVMPSVVLGLTLQGLWKSRGLVDRVFTLSGGDDWWAFEAGARDVIAHGWLMNSGEATGGPFFVYPGYGYFVAAMHLLIGESLAGVILSNFLVLAVATLLIYATARVLTSPLAAYVALAWLLVLEQLAFVRYYTVTLLSENLFFGLVAATVFLLIRAITARGDSRPWWSVTAAGVCGGLAAVTRPTMMLYLPVAMLLLAVSRWRTDGGRRAAAGAVVLAVAWMAAVGPVTLRNYLVSGRPVLITSGQERTFIYYNLPAGTAEENAKYFQSFDGSALSALRTLAWILWDHPAAMLRWWGHKIGFSLGMVHWADHVSPHPELLLTSVWYFASMLLLRRSRAWPAWAVHGFIATHLATLLLSAPWNYGYRMLLAMFMWMPIFAGALMAIPLERLLRRGGGRWKAQPA